MNKPNKNKSPKDKPLEFGLLANTTGFLVRRLHNLLSASWADDTAGTRTRMTPVQSGLLILINQNPDVTQTRLLKALDIEGPTLVRSVTKLVEAGLIEKTRNETDKRAFFLRSTEHGKSAMREIEREMVLRDELLGEDIDPKDIEVFHNVIRLMIYKRSRSAREGNLDGLLLIKPSKKDDD